MDRDLQGIQEARDALRQADEAQKDLYTFSQSDADRVAKAMCEAGAERARELGKLAVDETGIGRVDSKQVKNELMTSGFWDAIQDMATVGIIEANHETRTYEIAEPVGTVAAIIPTTNPTSTAMFKAISALKTRNTIVVSPHPNAGECTVESLRTVRDAALDAGAPEGCIGWIETGSIAAAQELMEHEKTDLILSTGGEAVVKAAYSSGKPAYGVGPGNVPVFIEKTADVSKAVERIISSENFDWGSICASEQSVVTEEEIASDVREEFERQNAHFLTLEEKRLLEKVAVQDGRMNPNIVGKSPAEIGDMAGIDVDDDCSLLLAEETGVGPDYPLSMEILTPLVTYYEESDWIAGCRRCIEVCQYGGMGHTLVIHTNDEEKAMEFALKKPAYRFLINSPASQGAVGYGTGLFPSMTLGCGTFGNNITADNIGPQHLLNKKRVSVHEDDAFTFGEEMLRSAMGGTSVVEESTPGFTETEPIDPDTESSSPSSNNDQHVSGHQIQKQLTDSDETRDSSSFHQQLEKEIQEALEQE